MNVRDALARSARRASRGAALRTAAALLAIVLAAGAFLLAHDVRSWNTTLNGDAMQYALRPGGQQRWTAPTILPAGVSGRLLSVARDRRWLSALRFFALAHEIPVGQDSSISPADTRLFKTSENALSRAAQDPDPAAASQAYLLLGVLLSLQAHSTPVPDLATSAAAIAAMQNAIRTDPRNDGAKTDLELLLRQRKADAQANQPPGIANQSTRGGHRRGRGRGVPPIAAAEGDY